MKKQSGFTLIELMVVMAIIAILATAGISAYTDYIKKARDTTRLSIASQVETAVNALMGSNGGVPPDSGELITYLGTLNMTAAIDALNGEEPRLLSSVGSMVRDFVGGSPLYALIREPSGGRAVCLGYNGTDVVGGQSCAFQYIVYGDNTYVIGYGIETETNMKVNFYNVATAAGGASQYMQVKGTAQYVGMPSIGETDGPAKDSVAFMVSKVVVDQDGTVTNNDLSSVIDETRSAPLSDETTGGDGGGGGGTLITGDACTTGSECASGICGNYLNGGNICRPNTLFIPCSDDSVCGDGFICSTYNGCTDRQIGSPCDTGLQCDSNYCNQSNANNAYTCTTGEAGVGCYDDTNCQSGLSCTPPGDGGICTSGGGGGEVGGGGTGLDGDYCSYDSSDCVGWCVYNSNTYARECSSNPLFGQCSSDAMCGNGLICTYNGCTDGALHSPCWTNEHCNTGYCYQASASDQGGYSAYTCTDGAAGSGCGQDINCQNGLTCVLIPEQFEGGICGSI